jgi:hypothetical protein
MFINPYISGQLAKDRQRDILAVGAEQQRLIRQLRTTRVKSPHVAPPGRRVRTWVFGAVARLHPAAGA